MLISTNTNTYKIQGVLISKLILECQNYGLLFTCQMMGSELKLLIEKVRHLGIKIKLLTLQKYIQNAYKTETSVENFYTNLLDKFEPLNLKEQEYLNLIYFIKELKRNKILY